MKLPEEDDKYNYNEKQKNKNKKQKNRRKETVALLCDTINELML